MTYLVPNSALPFSSSVAFCSPGINTPGPTPATMSIVQAEYQHDVVTMTFWGGDVTSSALESGTPVLISFGRQTIRRDFYGYVNHAGRVNNNRAGTSLIGRNAVEIVCVGASWPMKEKSNLVFTNMTASQIAQQVARMFNLDLAFVPHNVVWASRSMAGKSFWQFMCDLAKTIGYTFYCNGVQLVFKPRNTNPGQLNSIAAVYDYRSDPGGMPMFNPVFGSTSPDGGQLANRKLAGINPRTNQVIIGALSGSPQPTILGTAADTPVFSNVDHGVVESQDELDARLNGAGYLNQLYITARATAIGSAYVAQGSLVMVSNANGSQNGLWYVVSASHDFSPKTYEMPLVLGRDSLGAAPNINIYPPIASQPVGVLAGSLWRAQ